MQNFEFYNPTKIVFGAETIAKLADLVPATARVLILYGGASAKNTGTLDEVKAALGTRLVMEFAGIEPNPSYETMMQAVELVRREKLNFLLAVGGGSVIDGTKFVAAAAGFEGEAWEILKKRGRKPQSALPFGTVLTLPATGSEMNNIGVIMRKSTQEKFSFKNRFVFPQFSILDPTKTYTLPKAQIANGIADAFVHTVEQYLTFPVQAMPQDRFAEGLLQSLIEIAPKAMSMEHEYHTRANLMWVAAQAMNGLIGAGVPQDWGTHMIGHEITALYGIDHARTLTLVLPSLLNVQREYKRAKLLQYAERVWHISEGSEEQRIDVAISRTREFFESLGMNTRLSEYQLGAEAIEAILAQLAAHGMTALGEHQNITLEVSRVILQQAL
jgi:NADP-dependent alcohol dehydrogenase